MQLNKQFVKGFVTNIGGVYFSYCNNGRSLGIPSVVGTNNVLEKVKNGDLIALDGTKGDVVINPNQEQMEYFTLQKEKFLKYLERLTTLKKKESKTKDNHKVELA
ncbi:PEP-utilizing enzyme [Mycoplasmopsis felis]|uniref:PEP-utilizing enzyme n=1 Tax=Mycoplasmopsis felis TaxID=33923 RepID=UPI003A5C7F2E